MTNNKHFLILLASMIIIITLMLLAARPLTFFSKREISDDAAYILKFSQICRDIDEYYSSSGRYPKTLDEIPYKPKDGLDSLFEYSATYNHFTFRTRFPIDSSILIMTPDTLIKQKIEGQTDEE
ncbi:MAG: hypothetical protein R6U31_03130 [bacterium]